MPDEGPATDLSWLEPYPDSQLDGIVDDQPTPEARYAARDAVQLAFKKEADPKGLLNPGKMAAWDNPDFHLKPDQVYLFPGLQQTAAE